MRIERTETVSFAREVLRVMRAILVNGETVHPGRFIEVDAGEAVLLVSRGVAARATADEVEGVDVVQGPRSCTKPMS